MKDQVYVASSWRNCTHPTVVNAIRNAGYEVFDFRNPSSNDVISGFHWRDIDLSWESWTPKRFRAELNNPLAEIGFTTDMGALLECSACVMVTPCGSSSHLELGWCVGAGRPTAILLSDGKPELMYNMADRVCVDIDEVISFLYDMVEK